MSGRGKGGAAVKAKSKTRSSRAGLQFPVGRVHRLLRKGNYGERIHPLYRSLRGEWEPTRFAGQLKTLSRKWRVSRYAKTFGEIFLTDYCSP